MFGFNYVLHFERHRSGMCPYLHSTRCGTFILFVVLQMLSVNISVIRSKIISCTMFAFTGVTDLLVFSFLITDFAQSLVRHCFILFDV